MKRKKSSWAGVIKTRDCQSYRVNIEQKIAKVREDVELFDPNSGFNDML